MCLASERFGNRNDIGAVDHLGNILTQDSELGHGSLEGVLELSLVVCYAVEPMSQIMKESKILTNEGLPLASSTRVTSELGVGLETNLTLERGLDFTLVSTRAGEESTTELDLNEELRVELTGGRVERSSGDAGVDVVGSSNGVAIDNH